MVVSFVCVCVSVCVCVCMCVWGKKRNNFKFLLSEYFFLHIPLVLSRNKGYASNNIHDFLHDYFCSYIIQHNCLDNRQNHKAYFLYDLLTYFKIFSRNFTHSIYSCNFYNTKTNFTLASCKSEREKHGWRGHCIGL